MSVAGSERKKMRFSREEIALHSSPREDILRQYRYYLDDKDAEAAAERFLDAARPAMEDEQNEPS
jgi:hypothetical protein